MNRTISQVLLLLVIAVVVALGVNYLSPKGLALVGQWNTDNGVISANAKDGRVDPSLAIDNMESAKKIYDQGKTLFIDARAEALYLEGHIKGALSLPTGEFDTRIDDLFARYSLDQPIITYCSGRICEDSHHLARRLIDSGYEKVSIMSDGFSDWLEKGYPVE